MAISQCNSRIDLKVLHECLNYSLCSWFSCSVIIVPLSEERLFLSGFVSNFDKTAGDKKLCLVLLNFYCSFSFTEVHKHLKMKMHTVM